MTQQLVHCPGCLAFLIAEGTGLCGWCRVAGPNINPPLHQNEPQSQQGHGLPAHVLKGGE